jgi:hypothetical protein
MPTKRKINSKEKNGTFNTRSRPNRSAKKKTVMKNTHNISKTAQNTMTELSRTGAECLGGCKGFASHFFIKYLKNIGIITQAMTHRYIVQLPQIEMYLHLTSDNKYILLDHEFPISFLKDLTQEKFDEITKGNILYCSIYKHHYGSAMPVHTFILSDGDTIYNSWSTDAGIPCEDMKIYDKQFTFKEDEDECVRIKVSMSQKIVKCDNLYDRLNQLVTNQLKFENLSDLFGIDRSNVIGLGSKSKRNKVLHERIVSNDIENIMNSFEGCDILFLQKPLVV